MEFITQEKYLNNANKNYKEWFIDNNTYDIMFIPFIARDYLTAYLMSFQNLGRTAPDIDWVLEKLSNYDKEAVDKFSPLDIRLKGEVKSKDYYLTLLSELKDYVENRLNESVQLLENHKVFVLLPIKKEMSYKEFKKEAFKKILTYLNNKYIVQGLWRTISGNSHDESWQDEIYVFGEGKVQESLLKNKDRSSSTFEAKPFVVHEPILTDEVISDITEEFIHNRYDNDIKIWYSFDNESHYFEASYDTIFSPTFRYSHYICDEGICFMIEEKLIDDKLKLYKEF